MNRKKITAGILSGIFLVALSACGSVQGMYIGALDAQFTGEFSEEKFSRVEQDITAQEGQYLEENNEISFYLDRGLAAHFSGNYEQSNRDLEEAERLIEEAFTKSISEYVVAFAQGDVKKVQYAGEDFEDIYTNVFKALNYYQLGNMEAALVEVRRSNQKLQYLTDTYEAQAESWKTSLEEFAGIPPELNFSNSALARYLCVLLWRSAGNFDGARIDAQEAANAFAAYPDVYNFRLPPFLALDGDKTCDETRIPSGMARLNLLAFTGLSPIKVRPIDNYFWYRMDVEDYGLNEIHRDEFPEAVPLEKKVRVDISTLKPILTAFISSCLSRRTDKNEIGLYALMLADLYVNDEIDASLQEILSIYRNRDISRGGATSYESAAEAAIRLDRKLNPGIGVDHRGREISPTFDPRYQGKDFRPSPDEISEMKMVSRASPVTRIEAAIDGQGTFPLYVLEDMGKVTDLLHQRRVVRNNASMLEYIVINILQKGFDSIEGVPVVNIVGGTGLIGATVLFAAGFAMAELGAEAGEALSSGFVHFWGVIVDLFSSSKGMYDARIAQKVNKEMGRFDDRMGRYFPDKAHAGGINLAPGVYSMTINYYNGARLIHSERRENVNVRAGQLNLAVSYSF